MSVQEGQGPSAQKGKLSLLVKELLVALKKTDSFVQWTKVHPAGYLSHFFCQIDSQGVAKTNWEIGYFEPSSNKITVFVMLDNGDAEIKPADDVFQKEKAAIEELKVDQVKVFQEQATQAWKDHFPKFFPKEQAGDGFLILQTLDKNILWNFTVITKTIKFVNMKINAIDGKIAAHEEISLVQK